MTKQFNPQSFEEHWREHWENNKIYQIENNVASDNDDVYILPQLPYPSGSGLHMGHSEVYTACDIFSRFERMQGKNVLQVIGWDAFGLPAENYAIKTNVHPRINTDKAIDNFREQIKDLGVSVDWSREVGSHNPDYYKWTQWFFLLMYERGLAYRSKQQVNWCPHDQTVLANEQVEPDGTCERCGNEVEQREMDQWYLKITDYAERLYNDLDKVDWPEETVKRQRDWIGRSEGAQIRFKVQSDDFEAEEFDTFLLATGNKAKVKRIRMLLEAHGIEKELVTPDDLKLEKIEVKEDGTLEENALAKAQAYADQVDMPILAFDSGLFLDADTELDPVKVKRNALEAAGKTEEGLSQEEIATIMHEYYKKLAADNGGSIDAYFTDAFAIVYPNGQSRTFSADRPITITEKKTGELDNYFPLNSLYKIQPANVYYNVASKEQKIDWLCPASKALRVLLNEYYLEVFTTRPDTIFGATFMVSAPEHEVFNVMYDDISNLDEVESYINEANQKTDLEREQQREKTGVQVNGISVVNPVNGSKLPLFVADYVLGSYGTGAIMAVPAHDERDMEFAEKYELQIIPVVADVYGNEPHKEEVHVEGIETIIFNTKTKKFGLVKNEVGEVSFVAGGLEEDESFEDNARREISEEAGINSIASLNQLGGKLYSRFYHKSKKKHILGGGVVYLALTEQEAPDEQNLEDYEQLEFDWYSADEVVKNLEKTKSEVEHVFVSLRMALERLQELGHIEKMPKFRSPEVKDGILYNSGFLDGLTVEHAKNEIIAWLEKERVGERKIQFKLRDWSVSRQRFWGAPIPMVYDEEGKVHPVKEEDLPVILPDDVDFKPTGQSPLTYSEKFHEGVEEKYGEGWKREVDTLDTFMCSSWYFFRYIDPKNNEAFASEEALKQWMPVDFYLGGPEHVNGHLLYSRFFTKVLYDAGYIDFDEPFKVHRHQGLIKGPDGRKMSKRWGNVINPTDAVAEYGADVVRTYLMFMGPLEQDKAWSDEAVQGVARFYNKVWKLQEKVKKESVLDEKTQKKQDALIAKFIAKVEEDIPSLSFNTAIAKAMETVNELQDHSKISQANWENFLKALAPFGPFITEELWKTLGHKESIHREAWPEFDDSLLQEDEIEIGVQINGKMRGTIKVTEQTTEAEAVAKAKQEDNINKYFTGESKKVIYVPGRILNIIV